MNLSPEALRLKQWIRRSRRASGLTQPQLAKRLGLLASLVFRWEYESCGDLPNRNQLTALAAILGAEIPDLPGDLLLLVPPADENMSRQAPAEPVMPEPLRSPQELKVWLRGSRKRAKLTQAALGDLIGVRSVTICIWEHPAKRTIPTWPMLEQIAEACAIDLPAIHSDLHLGRRHKMKSVARREAPPPAGTLMGEIEQVANDLASAHSLGANRGRNAKLFLEYYGKGMTLQEIGDHYGLTRERVRQLIARMLEYLPALPARRDRFMEVAERCRDLGPMHVSHAEEQLGELLGGVTLVAAQTYGAHVLGEGLPVEIDTRQAVPMLVARGKAQWVPTALRHARRFIRFNGAALVEQVWAATQREHDERVTEEDVRTALQTVCGFAELDRTGRWFWFGEGDGANRLLDWSRRILATARSRVDIEHIHAGISRFSRLYDENSPITPILPTAEVLLMMLATCPDIEVQQVDDLKLIDNSLVPRTAPDSVIDRVIDLLQTHGGVMALADIKERLVEGEGINPISLSVQLACSPMIRRIDYGVYAIRGAKLDGRCMRRAYARNASEIIEIRTNEDGSITWDTNLTDGAILNRQMGVPAAACRLLPSGQFSVRGGGSVMVDTHEKVRLIRGGVRELLAMGGQAGDRFRVTLWPTSRECAFEPL